MDRPMHAIFVGSDLRPLRPLRMELRRRGARVDVVLDEDGARSRAEREVPDLVVLDGASDEEAPRLIRHFRELCPQTRLIHVQTAGSDADADPELLLSAGRATSAAVLMTSILEAFPGRLDESPSWHPVPPPILVVDDDEPFLASLVRLLHRHGYSVARCLTAHDALEAVQRSRPRLALIDVLMPGMSGLDLAEKIRGEHPDRPSLAFLTGLASEEAQDRGLGLGADFYLHKPCDSRKILDVVDYLAGDLDDPERELLRERLA